MTMTRERQEFLLPSHESEQPLTRIEREALQDKVNHAKLITDYGILWALTRVTHDERDKLIRSYAKAATDRSKLALPRSPTDQELKALYDRIVEAQKRSRKQMFDMPAAQRSFCIELRLKTKRKFQTNVLIGDGTVDLFSPAVGTPLSSAKHQTGKASGWQGIAIEIDGKPHDLESKGIRGLAKLEILSVLNILSVSIENCDIRHPLVLKMFDKTNRNQRQILCSVTRRLVWRKIHFITAIALGSDSDWLRVFGIRKFEFYKLRHAIQKLADKNTIIFNDI